MNFSDVSLLIIAGGHSSRMHVDKRSIEIGGVGLLERILIKASVEGFAEVILCVEERLPFIEELAAKYNAAILIDTIRGAGPISGLTNGLDRIKSSWALTMSCDMPFFEFKMLRPLLDQINCDTMIILPKVNGRLQPLSAFYRRETMSTFDRAMCSGERKLRVAIDRLPHQIVELKCVDAIFFNVNTPSDLQLARGRAANLDRRIPIISIVAPKSGTGKTTFIERLIPLLIDRNIRVGVVKSDAHGFNLDVEGKDSYRFQQSGASSVAVVSPRGWMMIQRTNQRADFLDVIDKMDDVDLILTESRTHAMRPTISLYRGLGDPIVTDDVAAIFTSERLNVEGIVQHDLNDIESAVDLCVFLMGR